MHRLGLWRKGAAALAMIAGICLSPRSAGGIIVTWQPVDGGLVTGGQPMPPLEGVPGTPATGHLFDPPDQVALHFFAHEGRFVSGADLSSPASKIGWQAWKTQLVAGKYATTYALSDHLEEAHKLAQARQSILDGQGFGSVLEALKSSVPGLEVSVDAVSKPIIGYPPLRARWLRSQYPTSPNQVLGWSGEKLVSYPDPGPFAEIRERGARLYCAARRAQAAQGKNSGSMLSRAGFQFELFGQVVEVGRIEQTVLLDLATPKVDSTNDGAQAFAVPLTLGSIIQPISFLPGLAEIQVPLVLLTGESEVTTGAAVRGIHTGWSMQCGWGGPFSCLLQPTFEQRPSKSYQTVSHGDAVFTAGRRMGATAHFPIFLLGPVTVFFDPKLEVAVGGLAIDDHRLLDAASLPVSGWPPMTRSGRLMVSPGGVESHDGAWALIDAEAPKLLGFADPLIWELAAQPDGATQAFWRTAVNLVAVHPLHVRAFQDDDHALDLITHNGLVGALTGKLGAAPFGGFEVSLSVTGSVDAKVWSHHVVRDAVFAQDLGAPLMVPVTGLTVRPRMRAKATLGSLLAKLRLVLDLGWFGDIDFTKELFSVPGIALADYDSDDGLQAGDERHFLRLGTGSVLGDPMKQPLVRSHLPQSGDFASFDVDVDACLADPTPPPPPREECPGNPPKTQLPQAYNCVYGKPEFFADTVGTLQPDICLKVESFVGAAGSLSAPEQECLIDLLRFLCSPVSNVQPWQGFPAVVSRLLDLSDQQQGSELTAIVKACTTAFVPKTANQSADNAAANTFFAKLLDFAACDAQAGLIANDEIVKPITPKKPPPLDGSSSCP